MQEKTAQFARFFFVIDFFTLENHQKTRKIFSMFSFNSNFQLALRLLVRSRLVVIIAICTALLAAAAWLAGQFSPRQPATVALDVGLSLIRLGVPILALLQIQDLVAREVERRLVLTSLTYPHSRAIFLVARYSAVIVAALIVTLVLCIALACVVAWVNNVYAQATSVALGMPFAITGALIWLDVAVVVCFGLVLATISTTPHLVFIGGVGFMVIARAASTIIQLLEAERDLVRGADWYHQGLQWVQWIVPDLASLDVRQIALYGKMELLTASPVALLLMPISYVIVLLLIACAIFSRRRFD